MKWYNLVTFNLQQIEIHTRKTRENAVTAALPRIIGPNVFNRLPEKSKVKILDGILKFYFTIEVG